MSFPYTSLQDALDGCELEQAFGQLFQDLSASLQVSESFKMANAAFAAQCTSPDAKAFMEACNQLAKFLSHKLPMSDHEQQTLVTVLQIACTVHENALNNHSLTEAQRSEHALASESFTELCYTALSNIRQNEHWYNVFYLVWRVDKSKTAAGDTDPAQIIDFGNSEDDISALSLPTPITCVHDAADSPGTLNDRQPKGAPLGRARTMPNLSRPQSMFVSGTGRTYAKPSSREQVLQAVQENEE